MRLFIAVQFDKEIVDELTTFQDELRKIGTIGNYTKEENLHLTLAFIGEYNDPDAVLEAMERVDFRPFNLKLDGYGMFGDLLWVGTTSEPVLAAIAKKLRHTLAEAGIIFDNKKFKSHVTLIRKVAFKSDQRIPAECIGRSEMTVKRISLMKSERGKNGMIYTELGYISAE